MSSTADHLVMMANQIAANLARAPEPAAAVAEHIRLYWDPRMKAMICAYQGEALSSLARDAVARLSS